MPPKVPAKSSRSDRDRSVSGSPGESPNQIDKEIAKRLLRVRTSRQLSQQEIAARAGFSMQQYAQIEAARIRIDASRLSKLAMALDLPLSWFFGQSHAEDLVTWDGARGGQEIGESDRQRSDRRIADLRDRLDAIRSKGSNK